MPVDNHAIQETATQHALVLGVFTKTAAQWCLASVFVTSATRRGILFSNFPRGTVTVELL